MSGFRPWWLKRRNHLCCPDCRAPFVWFTVSSAAVDHAEGCRFGDFDEVARIPIGRRMDAVAVLVFCRVPQ